MGGLTPAEQQMINTETLKGAVSRDFATDPNRNKSIFERAALRTPGATESAQSAIAGGTASIDDLLATGGLRSRYSQAPGRQVEQKDGSFLSVPQTQEQYLGGMNREATAKIAEAAEINKAVAAQAAQNRQDLQMKELEVQGDATVANIKARQAGLGQEDPVLGRLQDRLDTQVSALDKLNASGVNDPDQRKAMESVIAMLQRKMAAHKGVPALDAGNLALPQTARPGVAAPSAAPAAQPAAVAPSVQQSPSTGEYYIRDAQGNAIKTDAQGNPLR